MILVHPLCFGSKLIFVLQCVIFEFFKGEIQDFAIRPKLLEQQEIN